MAAGATAVTAAHLAENAEFDERVNLEAISPESRELVIGLVGYAGAGCSTVARKLEGFLHERGYEVHRLKLSWLIQQRFAAEKVPQIKSGIEEGKSKLERAWTLQDLGDQLRSQFGNHAIAALATKQIMAERNGRPPGVHKLAFICDSIKHNDEVVLLRRVYDKSFRLIAVHCERPERECRLIGPLTDEVKYRGADPDRVRMYIDRDEKDDARKYGQQVRDAFYLADYFLDNNVRIHDAARLNDDLLRFVEMVLGFNLVRPTMQETGMFHAQAAALQSACLSRQVGAALQAQDGRILATGTNEVPKFGGGVYQQEDRPDNRCFAWEWEGDGLRFRGCHNTRRKKMLREQIAAWFAEHFAARLAEAAHPKPSTGIDAAQAARRQAEQDIKGLISDSEDEFSMIPGVKDLIEFSRSIHAEMTALLNAARSATSPADTWLYCTTFPCHNCARHLVTAGVSQVYCIEPYVKSLAVDLHYDAIQTELAPSSQVGSARDRQNKMLILPFTGVGPRMYEDYFIKRGGLKDDVTGVYLPPAGGIPAHAVRLRELARVEEAASDLVPE